MTVEKFLSDLKNKFSGGDNKIMKVEELKKVEQESKMMKELRRAVRGSRYEERKAVN